MKTVILLIVWSLIYLAFTFERPGVGQGPPPIQGSTVIIPALLWLGLRIHQSLPKGFFWRVFDAKFWKPLALVAIAMTPILDLIFRYTSLTSPITPGTFTSVGLMGVIMLVVWKKYPTMNFKVFVIGMVASYIAVYISELEYQIRFTLHFFNQPLSTYDVLVETIRLPIVLLPCLYIFSKFGIRPGKWTWIFASVTLILLGIVWHSQYFLMYWNGSMWTANELNEPIYILNRLCKLGYMAIVLSLNYSRSVTHETVYDNQSIQHV